MTENQETINQWQRKTFPDATVAGIEDHLAEEFEEFLQDLTPEEAADIVILLYFWCDKHYTNLHAEIDKKMQRNRARSWNIQPDGTGRHT